MVGPEEAVHSLLTFSSLSTAGLNAAEERTRDWKAGLCLFPTSPVLKSKLFATIIITITLTIATIATIITKMQPERPNLDGVMALYEQFLHQDNSPGLTHIVIQSIPGQQGEPIQGTIQEGWGDVLPADPLVPAPFFGPLASAPSSASLASATSASSTSSSSNASSSEEGEQSQN